MPNYQSFVSSRVTQEAVEAERARQQAVLSSGYSFIVLQLKDRTKRRVTGVEYINPIKTEPEPGVYTYNFEVKTGQLVFKPDPYRGGMPTEYMLHTDWNMAFLASHKSGGYWEIVDVVSGRNDPITLEDVLEDVEKRFELSAQTMEKKEAQPLPNLIPVTTKTGLRDIPDDEIDARIKRMEEEKKRRQSIRKNATMAKKVPVGAVQKGRKKAREMSKVADPGTVGEQPTESGPTDSDLITKGAGVQRP